METIDTMETPPTPAPVTTDAAGAESPQQAASTAPADPDASAQQPAAPTPDRDPALPPLGLWEMLETQASDTADSSAQASARVLAHRRRSIWDR